MSAAEVVHGRPLRVAVVDDQQLVRAGFTLIIGAEPDMEVAGEAADGAAGVELVRRQRPDVVLMDIRMPFQDGIEATRTICAEQLGTRVLILTTFDLDEHVGAALRAGASGFLVKDTPPDELVRAIRIVAAGDALLSPSVTRQVLSQFVAGEPAAGDDGAADALTEREREVLEHLARGRSNAEIAAALTVAETTVKTHVGRILAKLDLRDRVQAVVFAFEHGIARPRA